MEMLRGFHITLWHWWSCWIRRGRPSSAPPAPHGRAHRVYSSGGSMKHRWIRLLGGNATLFVFKSNLQKDFAAAVHLFEARSPPWLLCWSGQKYLQVLNLVTCSDAECKSPAEYGLQHDSTHCMPILYIVTCDCGWEVLNLYCNNAAEHILEWSLREGNLCIVFSFP